MPSRHRHPRLRPNLVQFIAAFQHDHPGVELNLWQAAPTDQFDALRTGRLDLAFMPLLKPPGSDLDHVVVARDRLMAVCPAGHPLARRRSIRLGDLVAEPFVDLPETWTTRQIIDRAFEAAKLERRTTIVVNDIATCLELVGRGLGVSLLPGGARTRGELGVFVPLARTLRWDYALVRRADGTLGPAAREFLRRILPEGEAGLRPGQPPAEG